MTTPLNLPAARVHAGDGKAAYVRAMFDRIAGRYDIMNRLMTGGYDTVVRDVAARAVGDAGVRVALDVGCGTGDLALALARRLPGATVVGIDFSAGMLDVACRKRRRVPEGARVALVRADAMALPVSGSSADAIASAWVLRNVADIGTAFREAHRVLRIGARAAFVELTPVTSRVIGPVFRRYFHGIVPWVGARMSGHAGAYRYLPESVDQFPDASSLASMMSNSGFRDVGYRLLGLGTLALHVGTVRPAGVAVPTGRLLRRRRLTEADWDELIRRIPGAHALQSWAWGEFRRASGWEVERVAWERDGDPVAAATILRRRLPIPGVGVAYVPKGPIIDPACPDAWAEVLAYLGEFARSRRCLFIKVDPDVVHGDAAVTSALAEAGYARSRHQVQYPATMVVDLDGDDATLQGRMRSTWRRYVRKAEREGVTVEATMDPSEAVLQAFVHLYRETATRDGFAIRDGDYYRDALRRLCPAGLATVHLARRDGEILAVAVVLRFGNRAWYLWGATSQAGLATHAMYRLQWEAMRVARDAGCGAYDMWGAPEDPGDETDALKGVAWFKSGFAARHVRWIGAWDYVTWSPAYRLWLEVLPRAFAIMRRLRGESTSHSVLTPG